MNKDEFVFTQVQCAACGCLLRHPYGLPPLCTTGDRRAAKIQLGLKFKNETGCENAFNRFTNRVRRPVGMPRERFFKMCFDQWLLSGANP